MRSKKKLSKFFENYNLLNLATANQINSLNVLSEKHYSLKVVKNNKKVGAKYVG